MPFKRSLFLLSMICGLFIIIIAVYRNDSYENNIQNSVNKYFKLKNEIKFDSLKREQIRKKILSYNSLIVTKTNSDNLDKLYNEIERFNLTKSINMETLLKIDSDSNQFIIKKDKNFYLLYLGIMLFLVGFINFTMPSVKKKSL